MSEINTIEGIEQAQELGPTTQVYKATHKGDGSRLPFMSRSFISFSYGGKLIEDFGFIVSIDGDRMERGLYANFQDNVSETEVLDQRFFWSTHLSGTDLELTLSTDEVTENQIEEFKRWFCPGKNKELILSEHPNRAIMARIGAVPQLHMLPFEKLITTKIGKRPYHTSTTVYKGDITITFTFDDPLWYSIKNCIEYENDDDYDNIKIHLEDGIPFDVMLKYPDVYIGDKSKILDKENFYKTLIGEEGDNNAAKVSKDKDHPQGQIGPLSKKSEGDEIFNPTKENSEYFYYCGTAPSKPILQFTLTPQIIDFDLPANQQGPANEEEEYNLNNDGYITSPKNSFIGDIKYNTITIESQNKKDFNFTLPSIWTGYNQAISILRKMNNQPLADVRRALREGVNHWAPRAYAIVQVCAGNGEQQLNSSTAIDSMKNFLKNKDNEIASGSFKIDNKTGKSIGKFICRDSNNNQIEVEEEIGDMIRSNYLIIEDRNYPSEEGIIERWTENNPQYSHRIYHDVDNGLINFSIDYKNMYY